MSEELKEIKAGFDEVMKTFTALRSDVESVKGRDVVDEAKFDKMTDAITKQMEAIQSKQAQMEAAMQRGDFGAQSKGSDEAKAREQINAMARKGATVDEIEIKAMSTDSQPNGGYLVMPELSGTVVSRVFETSPLRQVANVEQSGTKSRTFLIDDNEASASWTGEKAVASGATPAIGQMEIVVHDITATLTATADMLEDAYLDLAGWMQTKGADSIGRKENTAFFSGSGVNQPRGLLTYSAWAAAGTYERGKVEQVISGAATTFTAEGLITMQSTLKEPYQASAVWLMKRASYGEVLKLKGADGFYFGPTMLKDGQASLQILGQRVIFCDDMQATGTGSNLIAAYGDFSRGYTILDRIGLQILRDPYTSKPYTVFTMRKRTGGDVTNFDAFKLMRAAAS